MAAPAAASSAPCGDIRELLAGAPSAFAALQQQRRNLQRFYEVHAADFASLRYAPWTTPVPAAMEGKTTMRASRLLHTAFGVYPTAPVGSNTIIAHYGGLLMSDALLDLFHSEFHCPTAMRLPQLNYTDSAGAPIRMQIVGDPTQHGPNMMDGGPSSNCIIFANPRIASITSKRPDGKLELSSALLQISIKACCSARTGDELLFAYEADGAGSFWNDELSSAEHCVICFSRAVSSSNPLIQCEAVGGACRVSRHRLCFASPPSQASLDRGCYFCPAHIGAARTGPAAAAAPCTRLAPSLPLDQMHSPVQFGLAAAAGPSHYTSVRNRQPEFFDSVPLSPPTYGFPAGIRLALQTAVATSLAVRLDAAGKPSPRPLRQAMQRSSVSAAAASAARPKHNLPPLASEHAPTRADTLKQVYNHEHPQQGLEQNCRYLYVDRRCSQLPGAGDGLVLSQARQKNHLIGYMFGHFLSKDGWNAMRAGRINSGSGLPDAVLQRHLQLAVRGTYWCLETEIAGDERDEYVCLVSDQCPMGYINDPRDSSRVNVELDPVHNCEQSAQGNLHYTLLPVYAKRDIAAGEELMLDYGWAAADWRESTKRAKKYARDLSQSLDSSEFSELSSSSSDEALSEAASSTAAPASKRGKRHSILGGHRLTSGVASSLNSSEYRRPPLAVRPSEAVCKLPSYAEQLAAFGQMSEQQRELLMKEVAVHRGKWFASGPRQRLKKQSRRAGAGVNAAVSSKVVAPGQVASNSKENWCDVDGISLDFVEYKCCCGSTSSVMPLLQKLTFQQFNAHSSTSVLSMMKERLIVRAQTATRDMFTNWVKLQLNNSVGGRVSWQGDTVCVSCFRALIGVSRSSMFNHRNKPDEQQRKQLDLTGSGQLRQVRAAPQLEVATQALRNYVDHFGQSIPNVRSTLVDEELIVLPAPGVQQLHDEVCKWDQSTNLGVLRQSFGRSTLVRAMKQIHEDTGVRLSISKSKMICRCADCDKLDNLIKETQDPAQRTALCTDKARHLKDVEEQRSHFNKQKELALQDPLRVWCMTFDGMDQAKTQLPSRPRFSKSLDGLPRLGLHVIGCFIFGAEDPVMGYVNYPDLRKDSSLSITTLENALNWQWLALVRRAREQQQQQEAPPQAAASCAASSAAAASAARPSSHGEASSASTSGCDSPSLSSDSNQSDDGDNEPAAARASRAPAHPHISAALHQAAARRWPQRLHVTFDNATGEAKNQFMFRYLGLLVLNNVFQYITVSTLIVGHTHDIVDQMFSVWARVLRITTAATYEAMSKLFREKYHSRIKGIVALMRGAKKGDAELAEATEAFGEEAMEEMLLAREAGVPDVAVSAKVAADLEQLVKELKIDAGFSPVIKLQSFSVNIKSWLELAKERGAEECALPNISNPHVFGIEKDEEGDVYLYNKFLVKSTDASYQGEQHSYLRQKTGSYSTRVLLHRRDNAKAFAFDPESLPAVQVDCASFGSTFKQFRKESAISKADYRRLRKVLRLFKRRERKQNAKCDTCKRLSGALASIGTVSRKKTATSGEKTLANEKSNERNSAQRQLEKHLREPHSGFSKKTGGWWGKWLHRSKYIVESYVERGYMAAPGSMDAPYHLHPLQLCSGEGEKPLFEAHERVDMRWLATHGKPKVGQYIVVRAAQPNEPFWIGCITELIGGNSCAAMTRAPPLPLSHRFWGGSLDEALIARYEKEQQKHWGEAGKPYEVRMSHCVPTPLHTETQLGVFAVRALAADDFIDFFSASMLDKDAVSLDEASHARRVSNVSFALDGGPFSECYTRYKASSSAGLDQMRKLTAAEFLPTHLTAPQLERFAKMPAGCMINSAKALLQTANVKMTRPLDLGAAMSHARVPMCTAIRAIQVGEELLCLYHNEEERSFAFAKPAECSDTEMADADAPAAPASSAAAAAAAAAAPYGGALEDEAYEPMDRPQAHKHGREHRADRNKTIMRMEDMPSVKVTWMDHHPADYTALKLDMKLAENKKYWHALHQQHAAPDSPPMAAGGAAAAAAAAAASAPAAVVSDDGPKPAWLVDMYKRVRFSEKSREASTVLSPSSFIVWGDQATIFSNRRHLKQSIWTKVREDLTEVKQVEEKSSKTTTNQHGGGRAGKSKAAQRPGIAAKAKRARARVSSTDSSSSSSSESEKPQQRAQPRSRRTAAANANKRLKLAHAESEDEDEDEDEEEEAEEEEEKEQASDISESDIPLTAFQVAAAPRALDAAKTAAAATKRTNATNSKKDKAQTRGNSNAKPSKHSNKRKG